MNTFHYQNNQLYAEGVSLAVIAEQFGTPCYVYSKAFIEKQWHAFDDAFSSLPHQICYAVKANSNLAILNLLAKLNSGFDIVSVGELERVIAAGGNPKKIIFSGVGKQIHEIKRALEIGIFCFNIESEAELVRINEVAAQLNMIAPVALRINPNIDAKTHPYIATGLKENKFGIEIGVAVELCQKIQNLSHLNLMGIGFHIGSQLTELNPFLEALDCLIEVIENLSEKGITLQTFDIGGGLGITYNNETPPLIQDYAKAIIDKLKHHPLKIILEPGRSIVGNAGILLTKVEFLKRSEHHHFAIVDAGLNDFMRPALYDAWHNILPVVVNENALGTTLYDVVGPVCETADFLGKKRQLHLQPNDLLAVHSAGAYGSSMSSNYNSRPRIAEVLVDGKQFHLIRERETIADLFRLEKIID